VKKVKKEKVKKESGGEDVEMDQEEEGGAEFQPKSDNEGEGAEENEDDEDDETSNKKKRKKAPINKRKPAKKAKKASSGDDEPSEGGVCIEMNQHVSLTFSLKYLVNFSKSSSLSPIVQLMMSNDVPLLVSYKFGQGHIRYYLAPKIGDE